MKEIGKILLYLLATILLGALLAPWLFWLVQWLGGHGILGGLQDVPFVKFHNRATIASALLLLWPVARWLKIPHWTELGLKPNPHRWRHFAIGVLVALLVMAALGFCAVELGLYRIKAKIPWTGLLKIVGTALVVAPLEEFLLRGAMLGVLRRTLRASWALLIVSLIYSTLHFLKPDDEAVPSAEVTMWSGFVAASKVFAGFSDPISVLDDFTTLFVLGWVLGFAVLRTQSLWLSIGLHAGCILGKFGFSKITKRLDDAPPWFGDSLQSGLAPLIGLVLMGAFVALYFRRADESRPPSRQ